MKIYTNENNTASLKLLIAANLKGKKVEIIKATFADVSSGPKMLPILEVNGFTIFSSNAATEYLYSDSVFSRSESPKMLELEATHLQPTVTTILTSKTVSVDVKQMFSALLTRINGCLEKTKFLTSNHLSSADISVWSTLYPMYHNNDLKSRYLSNYSSICKWAEEVASDKGVKEAVKQWGGSAEGPFGAISALGNPQITNLVTPAGISEETAEVSVTPEEIETAKENWLSGLKNLQPPLKHDGIKLPQKGKKNILITSALPYVNNVPHLGNIIGCVLSADIFARFCRLCDYNTLYVCGTDEYGTATETKALEEGVTPRQICDKYFAIHDAVYQWFNIGFDYFGRTSTEQQTKIAQDLFIKLKANDYVGEQSVEQLYCEKCERFLADRFVEGTCHQPGCGYDSARGDQCDKCGKLINAVELVAPRCKVCSQKPTVRPSKQLFIELGKLEPALRKWIGATESGWSPPARAVTRAWLRDSLRARAVTRDLKWGVPVPVEGYENKVFYVWFDAPIGYLSITQNATKDYEKWWKKSEEYDVSLYQFMAKDNVPFHVIMFPATVIGVDQGHILVKHIYATEYLNYEEGKFSKSRGVGVFGTDAQDTGIPSDVWRFYLASIRPETSDSSFSWTELGTRNNSELLNNLGNFCHRSLSFCYNSFKGNVPEVKLTASDYELIALVNREVYAYVQHMEKGRLREALRHVLSVSRLGNQHMQSTQPWVLLKGTDENKVAGSTAIGVCCQLVALLCTLLAPYMPDTWRRLREQLNIGEEALRINPENPSLIQYLPTGHVINKPEPLFTKLEPDMLDKLRAKYAGTQSERASKNGEGKAAESLSVAELEAAVAAQGEKVRQLKSTTKDKAVWQPEVNRLLDLKKQLSALTIHANSTGVANSKKTPQVGNTAATGDGSSVADVEKAVAEQGEKVRQLKSTTKDKAVWQPEVNRLLDLKKQLSALTIHANSTGVANSKKTPQAGNAAPSADGNTIADLEEAIAEQADKVRKLKASTKDKAAWQPEVNTLLDLKKQLALKLSNK